MRKHGITDRLHPSVKKHRGGAETRTCFWPFLLNAGNVTLGYFFIFRARIMKKRWRHLTAAEKIADNASRIENSVCDDQIHDGQTR